MEYHRPHWTKGQIRSLNKAIEDGATVAFTLTGPEGEPCNGGESSRDQYARPGLVQESKGSFKLCYPGVFHATLEPHKWKGSRVWIVALYGEVQREGDFKLGASKREFIGEVLAHEATDPRIGAKLGRKDLAGADLNGASLAEANLVGADLSEVDLSKADLRYAKFHKANLNEADLSGANLSCASLKEASLNGANLKGVNLNRANLRVANLRGANLSYATLYDTDLRETDLNEVNLNRVNLNWTKLYWESLGEWVLGPDGYARKKHFRI
jgi:uncharacterized protein YjbI with pentapeptide repeats